MFEAHSSCCRCSCCCCCRRCCCSQNTGFMVSILSVCWSSHDHHFTLFGYHYVLSVCFNASGRSAFFYRKVDMESLSFADTTVHAVNTKSRQAVTNLHICRLGRTSNIKTNKTTTTKTKKKKRKREEENCLLSCPVRSRTIATGFTVQRARQTAMERLLATSYWKHFHRLS